LAQVRILLANLIIHFSRSMPSLACVGVGIILLSLDPVTCLVTDASTSGRSCAQAVLRGLDNLLGVCEAHDSIQRCTRNSKFKRCRRVRGPGGSLITKDITEDVTLGEETPTATASWHRAFTSCAKKGLACAEAVQLHSPVLRSVQLGLMSLLSSSRCQQSGFHASLLSESDFVSCGERGRPEISAPLVSLVKNVRMQLPAESLARFPLHDVVAWAEPDFALPAEIEDD